MNIFSTNQVNQVYVVTAKATTTPSQVGEVALKVTPDKEYLYFQHFGKGGLTRSDLIPIKNIMWGRVTPAARMRKPLKSATVTLSQEVLDASGNPEVGQDYILRLTFDNYIGISPEDSQYWKHGVVHAHRGMSASDFYKAMAISLAKSMSKEAIELVEIGIKVGTAFVKVSSHDTVAGLTQTAAGVIIREVEPDWILGLKQQKVLTFKAEPTEITVIEGVTPVEVTWGTTEYETYKELPNGKLMADYEYFYMGERGDQYRMKGWPNYVPTEYMVDPTKEYDTIAIHYAFTDSNESVQKSEKDITLLVPTDANLTSTITSDINNTVGTSVIVDPRVTSSEE